jgi:hypothetical protein
MNTNRDEESHHAWMSKTRFNRPKQKENVDRFGYPINPKPTNSILKKDIPDPTNFELAVWEMTDALAELLIKKHKDYGPKNISDAPGGALNGLRVRIHDKTARINNLVDLKVSPQNESLEDSFMDLANYAIIGLMVLKGKWDK